MENQNGGKIKKDMSVLEAINKFLIPITAFLMIYTFNKFDTKMDAMEANIAKLSEIRERMGIIEYTLGITKLKSSTDGKTSYLESESSPLIADRTLFIKPEEYDYSYKGPRNPNHTQ